MARVAWTEVDSLPDILSGENYMLVFGSVPIAGSTLDLSLKCQNVIQAGMSNEAFDVPLHGFVKRFRGRKMYPRQFQATFVEVSDFSTINKLRQWMEYVAGSESGTSGGYLADYSVTAVLYTYDTTGKEVNRTYYDQVFPQDIPDVTMDSTSSQPVVVSATFSYARIRGNGHPLR